MQKNIWLMLTAGVALNVAAFAGDETASTEGDAPSIENRVVAYVNSGDETASTDGDETPASALLSADSDEEEVPADSLLAADADEEE
ncbi:MAG: hypothetical protein JSR57_06225, partial [Verrucomicrobia bacterium]|nr:hypothetical protein [Verrucomicrobiota bacterium]